MKTWQSEQEEDLMLYLCLWGLAFYRTLLVSLNKFQIWDLFTRPGIYGLPSST